MPVDRLPICTVTGPATGCSSGLEGLLILPPRASWTPAAKTTFHFQKLFGLPSEIPSFPI